MLRERQACQTGHMAYCVCQALRSWKSVALSSAEAQDAKDFSLDNAEAFRHAKSKTASQAKACTGMGLQSRDYLGCAILQGHAPDTAALRVRNHQLRPAAGEGEAGRLRPGATRTGAAV